MPREAYPGDATSIRLASLHWILCGEIGIPESKKWSLGSTIEVPGQNFFFNKSTGKFYPKWGALNTVLFTPPLLAKQWQSGFDNFFLKFRPQNEIALYDKSLIRWLNFYNLALTVVISFYLWKLAGLYTENVASTYVFVLACCFATYLWNYLRAQSSEIFQILFFTACIYHFIRFYRSGKEWRHLALSACLAGLLTLTKSYYALLFPLLGLFAFKRTSGAKLTQLITCLALPAAVSLSILMAVQWHQFGSPSELGYSQWKHGDITHDHMSLSSVIPAFKGFFIDPSMSIFTHFPILLLALFGFRRFWKLHRAEYIFILTVFILFLIFLSTFSNWSGQYCYGPRYLIFILPVLCLPLVSTTDEIFEKPLNLKSACITAILIVTIAWSAALQNRVNSLPFFSGLYLCRTYEQLNIAQADACLDRRHLAMLSGEFLDHVEKGKPFAPLEVIRRELPPNKQKLIGKFEEYHHSTTFAPNFFWAYD